MFREKLEATSFLWSAEWLVGKVPIDDVWKEGDLLRKTPQLGKVVLVRWRCDLLRDENVARSISERHHQPLWAAFTRVRSKGLYRGFSRNSFSLLCEQSTPRQQCADDNNKQTNNCCGPQCLLVTATTWIKRRQKRVTNFCYNWIILTFSTCSSKCRERLFSNISGDYEPLQS